MTATPSSAQTGASAFRWPHGTRAAVSLSFDDSRWSQVERGLPVLDAAGVHATFYVMPAGVEGARDAWAAAAEAGHEMGCHTASHPCSGNFLWSRGNALEDYTLVRIGAEMEEADRRIEAALGVRPRTFAYPCGQTFVGRGERTASYVPLVAARYAAGRGFLAEAPNDPAFCDLAQVAAVSADGLDADELIGWVRRAEDEGGWLIFAGHDVGEPGRRQTVHTRALAALCAWCKCPENGIWIDTVAAVAEYVERSRG